MDEVSSRSKSKEKRDKSLERSKEKKELKELRLQRRETSSGREKEKEIEKEKDKEKKLVKSKTRKSSSKKDLDKEKKKKKDKAEVLNPEFIKDVNVSGNIINYIFINLDYNYEKKRSKKELANKNNLDIRTFRDINSNYDQTYNPYMNNMNDNFSQNLCNLKITSNRTISNPKDNERCDGCFDGDAQIFCVNCEKIFCRDCENQIHVVPVNRLHER